MSKEQLRPLTADGFCVRQAEEALESLQKENFNLKLRMYFLENKYGQKNFPSPHEKEFVDLFIENESLKEELREKQEIMRNALNAIEILEREKIKNERKTKCIIEEQSKKIECLKAKSKISKRKKYVINPAEGLNVTKMEENLQMLKSQNGDLFARINDLKKEVSSKLAMIEKLSSEKSAQAKQIEILEKKLKGHEEIIKLNNDKNISTDCSPEISALLEENGKLKCCINELVSKSARLDKNCKDYEKLIQEQSELMKGLNRTIEAKNEELLDYKWKLESSASNLSQFQLINLNEISSESKSASNFPFHNPLFGSFDNLYR